jgi:glycosyltransferase involved in cell wall biosynthesis
MKRILIIPSWYPTDKDRIVGSFFQEQANTLMDMYDIKVLYINFISPPALKLSPRRIASIFLYLLKYLFQRNNKVELPDDDIFLKPPVIQYKVLTFALTKKSFYKIVSKKYISKIESLIKNGWSPDLIHAQSVHVAGIIGLHAKQQLKIPYVITEHVQLNILSFPGCIQRTIKEAFQKSDCVLSVSFDKVRQLELNGISVEPNIIYNYVDESIFYRIVPRYKTGAPIKIISVGAASYIKDHLTLLKALKIIQSKGIPFNLTLIGLKIWGDNKTYKNTLQYIETNGLKNYVQVIDMVTREEIAKYLFENNVFLITSIAEGLPISVLEAMSTGLTVIATKHGGTEDILTPETGILVKIKDSQDIAEKLIDIYNGTRQFEPKFIRDHIVSICGRKAFSERLSSYYEQAIYNNNNYDG